MIVHRRHPCGQVSSLAGSASSPGSFHFRKTRPWGRGYSLSPYTGSQFNCPEHAQLRSNFKGFFFVTHQCMASKTSVSFLVVCGIFLLIFLVALFFLLYYFLRRACLVKAIEIIHTEANQQQNQLSVDRLHVFTESNMTSISAPAVQNDHCKTSSFNVRQTLRKEDIEVTIL